MRNLFTILFIVSALSISYPQDTINVPEDYTTIQAAIDAANNGDIVLVAEDTYYENINFKGKAITVASHFLIDGDSTHTENTIINGSQPSNPDSGSVVYFISGEDTASVLFGFTITGGLQSGIYCINSSAKIIYNNISSNSGTVGGGIGVVVTSGQQWVIIENNTINKNYVTAGRDAPGIGGGIFCGCDYNGLLNGRISDNYISQNDAYGSGGGWGGGVAIINCSLPINKNIIIGNKSHYGNYACRGGGVFLSESNSILFNNIIAYNITESGGGGIYIENAQPTFINNAIANNTAVTGGGIITYSCSPIFIDNTISNNSSPLGSGIHLGTFSHLVLINDILWNDSQQEISFTSEPWSSSTVIITNSDIQGGLLGIIHGEQDTVYWLDGNIDVYPEFVDTTNGDYHLSNSSPCIGAGIDSIEIGGFWYYCPLTDLEGNPRPNPAGTMPDMGAYESPLSVSGIKDYYSHISKEFSLAQNFPNPFNPSTTIRYEIPEKGLVTLRVYDVLGNEVATLVNEEKPIGNYEVEFNVNNLPDGKAGLSSGVSAKGGYASGVYFYQLNADNYIETKKMIRLK